MNKKKAIALACVVFIGGYLTGIDNGKQQKVTEIQNKLNDLDMEWYQWQDVEKIVTSKSINSEQ